MANSVDLSEIRFTGENSFMRLSPAGGDPVTTQASHWRALLSPGGSGHVLFLQSELTDNQVAIYSDNIALARWLQAEIEQGLNPGFADQGLAVTEAVFSRHGDVRSFFVEKVVSRDMEIALTWYDLGEPFLIHFEPGSLSQGLPHGVYSVLIPANKAQVVANGRVARGRPFAREIGGHAGSSCSLAWSETWVRPR